MRMNDNFYNEMLDRLNDVKDEINDIIHELSEREEHKRFVRIFGKSLADDKLYSASINMERIETNIQLEIRNQQEGRL